MKLHNPTLFFLLVIILLVVLSMRFVAALNGAYLTACAAGDRRPTAVAHWWSRTTVVDDAPPDDDVTTVSIPSSAPLSTTNVAPASLQPTTNAPIAPLSVVAPPNNTMVNGSGVNVPLLTPAAATAKYGSPADVVVNCIQTTPTHPGACIVAGAGQGSCAAQGLTGAANCSACAPADGPGCALMSTMYNKMYANGDLLGAYAM